MSALELGRARRPGREASLDDACGAGTPPGPEANAREGRAEAGSNGRALVIDDEPAACELLVAALGRAGFETQAIQDPGLLLERLAASEFDVVVTDMNMPTMTGVDVCRMLRAIAPRLPVIVVTAFGSVTAAVDSMKAGAFDFVAKPFDLDSLGRLARRAATERRGEDRIDQRAPRLDGEPRLIGDSEVMHHVRELIERVKDSSATLLITGETGTGKELVAREIHARGRHHRGPFLLLNCAAEPQTLLEGEPLPQGGTVLLDEIADLSPNVQAKLLRVLQERALRAGAPREPSLDTRVIATTNRNLEQAVATHRLREDLYHRLNVIRIDLPPLRERGGDSLRLARHFLAQFARRAGRNFRFTAAAEARLTVHDWPGNVRELRNCIERAITFARAEWIDVRDLSLRMYARQVEHDAEPERFGSLDDLERTHIARVIGACEGNKSRAARILGVSRKTLYRRMETLGIAGAAVATAAPLQRRESMSSAGTTRRSNTRRKAL